MGSTRRFLKCENEYLLNSFMEQIGIEHFFPMKKCMKKTALFLFE
jgi:hypothetical protein